MTQQDNGGPAFPRTVQQWNSNLQAFDGMSLRDWFAGQALAGLCANMNDQDHPFMDMSVKHMGELAYNYADEMIAARKVQP